MTGFAKKISAHIIVRGRVQGVGFRWFVRNKAYATNVKGWVRNMLDGGVEIFAEGDRTDVLSFIDWCKVGPPSARVDHAEVRILEYTGTHRVFSIRH